MILAVTQLAPRVDFGTQLAPSVDATLGASMIYTAAEISRLADATEVWTRQAQKAAQTGNKPRLTIAIAKLKHTAKIALAVGATAALVEELNARGFGQPRKIRHDHHSCDRSSCACRCDR